MNRTDRLYAIVESLRLVGSRGRTCGFLSEQFEVSTRTIKRDIAALIKTDVPIISFDGRGGGYSLSGGASLPPMTFTRGEITAMAIALKLPSDLPFAPDGSAALDKLVGTMTADQRNALDRLMSQIWLPEMPKQRNSSARTIEEALNKGVVAAIKYDTAGKGKIRSRRIEAMAFVRTRNHWQVMAWCQMRKAGRMFRLDRIVSASLTNQPVVERRLFDVFGDAPSYAQKVSKVYNFN